MVSHNAHAAAVLQGVAQEGQRGGDVGGHRRRLGRPTHYPVLQRQQRHERGGVHVTVTFLVRGMWGGGGLGAAAAATVRHRSLPKMRKMEPSDVVTQTPLARHEHGANHAPKSQQRGHSESGSRHPAGGRELPTQVHNQHASNNKPTHAFVTRHVGTANAAPGR